MLKIIKNSVFGYRLCSAIPFYNIRPDFYKEIMKKLCLLANASSVHTHRWANYFVMNGYEVSVISFEDCTINFGPVKVYTIHTNKKFLYISFPIKWIQMQRLLQRIRPDIIHAHYVTKYGFFGALFGKHPFIISVLGSDILKSPALFNYPIRWILAKADIIHCDAYFMVSLLKKLGVPEEKVRLVFFGTDTLKFSPDKKSELIRAGLGVQSEVLIISTRKLDKIYDIGTLIQAVPLVVKRHSNVKFVIVGDGDQKASLVNLASSLKVSQYIIFLGFLPNDKLPKYLASADIYVSTSTSDAGLAASTAEAMSSGIPVIITEFGDNSIWVKDTTNGLTFPIGDFQSLAEKICLLIENDGFRNIFGSRGREIIDMNNNYYKEMEKVDLIYQSFWQKDISPFEEELKKR